MNITKQALAMKLKNKEPVTVLITAKTCNILIETFNEFLGSFNYATLAQMARSGDYKIITNMNNRTSMSDHAMLGENEENAYSLILTCIQK